jgi:dTDP-4-dehydrorhamnose reductase
MQAHASVSKRQPRQSQDRDMGRDLRILVTGRQGQLAMALAEAARGTPMAVTTAGRPGLDLTQARTIEDALASVAPDVVINTAAYTAVDRAESEPDAAFAVNGDGAGLVAACCAKRSIPLIQISTDYVFAGNLARPYREDDAPGAVGVYGRSKLAGERQVAAAGPRHVIVRTSWVHSPWGHNFVKTMLKLGQSRSTLSVVNDQSGCPTYAPDLAAACLAIAQQIAGESDSSPVWGPCHVVGGGETTWHGFAREIFTIAQSLGAQPVDVVAIPTADYPTPAKRPANSRLDGQRLRDVFAITMPDWTAGTRECVHRLMRDEI